MVDARAIDVSNRIAQGNVIFSTSFQRNTCCPPSAQTILPESQTPEPVPCICNECDEQCEANYGSEKLTGSRPVQMVIEATKRNTNYLLVPVNISKQQASRLYNPSDAQRYATLNELGQDANNFYWRDTLHSDQTSTSEHLSAFANVARNENDAYLRDMLAKHLK